MSRTNKDRPYWVKLNDRSIKHKETHDHHNFGRPHTYRDANGEVVTVASPDYCTIDEPMDGGRYGVNDPTPLNPCSHWFHRHQNKKWYKSRATNNDIQNWVHGPMRAQERVVLGQAVKEYNSMGYVDENQHMDESKFLHSSRYEY